MTATSDLIATLQGQFPALTSRPSADYPAVNVSAASASALLKTLRDSHGYDMLMDLTAVDYAGHPDREGPRFEVVYHLLASKQMHRLRVKAGVPEMPCQIDSCVTVWPAANWMEREAFDLYGIMFAGHPDLRRLLTDYGFIGHPFRKDFPVSGHVEMRFDPEQARVIYQPVTIEPRVITPRIIREQNYADTE